MFTGTNLGRAEKFVEELTELSRKHGVGIADEPTLFMLEAEDADREYRIDDESRLVY